MLFELNGAPVFAGTADRMTPDKAVRKPVAELPDTRLVEIAPAPATR